MPLPEGFSSWEHLQAVLMHTHNRIVREDFRDVGDDDWEADISTPRSSLRVACTIRDDDSAIQSIIRMLLFYIILRKASDMQIPVYGIPTDTYQESVKFRPQVLLFFREDLDDVDDGYNPIEAEISFRLMRETSESIVEGEAINIANKVRTEFATGNGYRWQKGRLKVSYKDSSKGYNFSINAYSEVEARELINKVMDIQGHVLNEDYLTISQMAATPPIVPPTEFIYGQSRRLPRKRPVGWVRFQYAELHIWGIKEAIILVDRTYRRRNPLVQV